MGMGTGTRMRIEMGTPGCQGWGHQGVRHGDRDTKVLQRGTGTLAHCGWGHRGVADGDRDMKVLWRGMGTLGHWRWGQG